MPVTRTGLVYYLDDTTQSAFRIVYPTHDDSELNDPQWTTMAVDPARVAVLRTVPVGSASLSNLLVTPSTTAANVISIFALSQPAVVAAIDAAPNAILAINIQNAVIAAATAAAALTGATPASIAAAAVAAA